MPVAPQSLAERGRATEASNVRGASGEIPLATREWQAPKWCPSERDVSARCSPEFALRLRRLLRYASRVGEVAPDTDAPSPARAGGPTPRQGAPGVTVRGVVSMRRRRADEDGDREIAELAALADGSLEPERRDALEARVAASSELADRLAEQQRAVALTQSVAEGVGAPAALRARVEAQRRSRRGRATRRLVLAGAATTAALVAAVAVAVSVLGSGTSAESFHAALAPTKPGARSNGRGDAHQDHLGLADRARCHRASPPRRGTLLPGVAAGRRRHARAGRDLQRGQKGSRSGRGYRRRSSRR